MPRSKHKNGKLIRKLNRELKRSKKNRASRLKLRNKCGGSAGKSSDKPSNRKISRTDSYSKAIKKKPKGLKSILQGPMGESVLRHLTSHQLSSFAQASTNTYRAVETFYPTSSDIRYKNLIDIYDEFKKVIKKIKEIDLTDKKNDYLQTPDKLKEIQEVYKNEKNVVKEDKIKRINELITIFFKYFNMYKPKKGQKNPNLKNYMNYLREKSSKFGKYSEDIERGLAILTLFYGFSDNILGFIFNYTGNKSEILNDYIYLLNELFTKHTGEKFYTQLELISSVPGVANKLNREGIEEYVKRRTTSGVIDKPHPKAYNELIRDTDFKTKYARSG